MKQDPTFFGVKQVADSEYKQNVPRPSREVGSPLVPVTVVATADKYKGEWQDTSVEVQGRFAVAGSEYDEFVEALRVVIERFQI